MKLVSILRLNEKNTIILDKNYEILNKIKETREIVQYNKLFANILKYLISIFQFLKNF
jgi:hypothetical protein